eukprot:7384434-Prymnesium_polylepis.2
MTGLSTSDKQGAAKPETLWTSAEVDLLVGSNPVPDQAAAPAAEAAASSVDEEEAVEKAVEKKADAADVSPDETEAAQAQSRRRSPCRPPRRGASLIDGVQEGVTG